MSENEELILGGFDHDGSSDSDSELSETWSELGAQIFDNEGPLFSTQAQYDPDGRMDNFKYENLLDEEIQNNGEESNTSISMDIKVDELILDGEDDTLGQVDFKKRKSRQNPNQQIPKNIISSNSRNLRSAGKNDVATNSFQNIVYNKDNISAKLPSFSNPYPYLCDGCKRKFVNLEDYKSHVKNVEMNCQNPILFLYKSRDINSTTYIRSNENEEQSTAVTGPNFSPKISDDNIDQIIELVVKGQGSELYDIKLNRKRKKSISYRKRLANETEEQRARRLENIRKIQRERIAVETEEQRVRRLENMRKIQGKRIANETEEQRARRLENIRKIQGKRIANETEDQRARRLEKIRKSQSERIANETEEQRVRRLENRRLFYDRKAHGELKAKGREGEIGPLTLETEDQKLRNCGQKQDLEKVQKFTCDKCQIDFSKLCYLSGHNKRIHPEIYLDSMKHVCETCGKMFKYNNDFLTHQQTHGEKIYSCPFENCKKSFALENYIKNHILRFHSPTSGQPREKVYLCETCGQGFSELTNLNLHKKEHLRLLHLRKQAYENKIRSENPTKNDQEIKDILSKFWESRESLDLKSAPETFVEKKARNKLKYIEDIEKKGLQKVNESIDECLERLRNERIENKRRKRESETEEERTARRIKYRKSFNSWKNKNKEEYNKKQREYLGGRSKFKSIDKKSEKYKNLLAKSREKWAKQAPEKKSRRLESMRKYQQSKVKRNSIDKN